MARRLAFGLVFCGLFLAPLATAQAPSKPSPPTEKEIALGRALAAEHEAESGRVGDAAVVAFVESITQKLAEASGTQTFLTVQVLDSPEAAAHSLPGGFLLVRAGLVAGVETTAEFAGVLAHEIAHIAAGHGNRQASTPPGHRAARIVPMIYLGGWMGSCARVGERSAVPVAFLARAGRDEEQADLLALEYLDRAGYDPDALVEAFDRLSRQGTPEAARMTSAVRGKAREYSPNGRPYISTSSAFDAIRKQLSESSLQRQSENAPSLRLSVEP
jgi:predicted Zn-dependent protease